MKFHVTILDTHIKIISASNINTVKQNIGCQVEPVETNYSRPFLVTAFDKLRLTGFIYHNSLNSKVQNLTNEKKILLHCHCYSYFR
jgi:phosphorylcholine metabolism protein LicD